jgi:hypothetical protein
MVSATRSAIESMYKGLCTVSEMIKAIDPITKVTSHNIQNTLIDQKCRLSRSRLSSTEQTEGVANIALSIKLFIAPDIVIKSGSTITVTQNGTTNKYKRSGVPAVYTNHQEILLEISEEYA